MNRDDIKNVIHQLKGFGIPLTDQAEWVAFPCIFAPWTHKYGQDRMPSAGVSVRPNDVSIYSCYSCKAKYPFYTAVENYGQYTKTDLSQLAEAIKKGEYFTCDIPPWGEARGVETIGAQLDKRVYLGLYESAEDHWYPRYRGISKGGAERLELMLDPRDSRGDARILFPVYSRDFGLYGFTGRAIAESADGKTPKVRDYYGLPKKHLLLGAHLLPYEPKYIILVEGLFGYARLAEMGFPVVASMSAHLSEQQADILRGIAAPVYVFYDNDVAGQKGAKQVAKQLKGYTGLWGATNYPKVDTTIPMVKEAIDKGFMFADDIANDPGEISKENVHQMMGDADVL